MAGNDNLGAAFAALLPKAPLLRALVTASTETEVTAQLPDGGLLVARGTAEVGSHVFIQGGAVQGAAPSLTNEVTITI